MRVRTKETINEGFYFWWLCPQSKHRAGFKMFDEVHLVTPSKEVHAIQKQTVSGYGGGFVDDPCCHAILE